MRILLTGAGGQLGQCFVDRFPSDWELLATTSQQLNINDGQEVRRIVDEFEPHFIVNAAAYTAVDNAEKYPEQARQVNVHGVENLALAAQHSGSRLIHISTDYVFDGNASTPYCDSDATSPLGVYGKTKLDGERVAAETNPDAIIIRTAWVFSEYGTNFLKTMVRLAKDRSSLSIVSDQLGCPTYAGDIAMAVIQLISVNASCGIYHFCGDRSVTWSEFAQSIFQAAHEQGILQQIPDIKPISTAEYPTPARRPKYSVLDCSKIARCGVIQSPWAFRLKEVLKKL